MFSGSTAVHMTVIMWSMSFPYVGQHLTPHLVQLKHNAPDAPDIAGLTPSQLQDHLRGPVVPGGHHAAVVLPVEGGGAEVNELHPGVSHPPDVPLVG